MFHLDTPVGRLLLTMENSGGIVKGEDEETGLTWNPGEIRIVQGGRVDG